MQLKYLDRKKLVVSFLQSRIGPSFKKFSDEDFEGLA